MAYVNRQLIPKDRSLEQAAKRVLDVVIAGGLLIALAPVLAAIVLIVRLSSGSPVVYRWRVVGQHGRYFTGYKFRTMDHDADQHPPR